MFIFGETIDDIMQKTFDAILKDGIEVNPTKGKTKELSGVLLKLKNPLGRLSRTEGKGTIYSCLGELLWYLSGSNSLAQIQYYLKNYHQYSDDNKTIFGAYGPKLFGIEGKFQNIINSLKKGPETRKAVIQLFSNSDIQTSHKDVPCTCVLQFMIRNEKLHLYTCMRSNDAYKGLPHDVFSFTMLQELAARKLGIPIGEYSHYVTSLHIYIEDLEKIKLYQKEGWQEKIFMPEMPNGDQTENVLRLLKQERELRLNNEIASARHTEDYWNDLTSLLQIFNISKNNNCDSRLTQITSSIKNNELKIFAARKIGSSQANGGNFVYL